jgi:hypothetical protein
MIGFKESVSIVQLDCVPIYLRERECVCERGFVDNQKRMKVGKYNALTGGGERVDSG